MAKRSGGMTRTQPRDDDAAVITTEQAHRAQGIERGTPFDWQSPERPWTDLYDDHELVVAPSDREWVSDVERMLERGGQPAAVEKALTLPLRSANLTIEKPEKDKGQTEFVREVLYSSGQTSGMRPDLVAIVSQMAGAVVSKKTFHELVFNRRKDGRVGYQKVAWRPPSSCEIIRHRADGELRGFRQYIDWQTAMELGQQREITQVGTHDDLDYGYVRIPANRAVVHVHGQHRNPIDGMSDLAVTHWAWTMQQKILMLWATFLDGQSQPKVVAYGETPDKANQLARTIASLRGSGVVGVTRDGGLDPALKLFETLDTSGSGAAQFAEMVLYFEQCMTKSVLAGFLDLTSNATRGIGSYALSADQSGLFLTSRQAAAKELAASVNDQLIAPLVRINFGHDAAVPRLVFEQMGQEQSDKAMQMLQQLGSAQNVSVPPGFLDLLIERVSQFLDLPDEKVEKLLTEQAEFRRKQAEMLGRAQQESMTPDGQLTDTVNAAGDMVKAKQNGRPINREQLQKQGTSPALEQLKQDRQEKQ